MKLTISLLLCSLLIGSLTSAGQAAQIPQKPVPIQNQETQQDDVRPYGRTFIMFKKILCNDSEFIYDLLKNEPGPQILIFFGQVKNRQGDVTMITEIFINEEDYQFSIIESNPQGISCIISAGFNFNFRPPSQEREKEFLKKGIGMRPAVGDGAPEIDKEFYKLLLKIRRQN